MFPELLIEPPGIPLAMPGFMCRALLLSPLTPITHLPLGSLGFFQLGAQGLGLAGCGHLPLLGLLQPLEQLLLPPLDSV